MDSTKNVPMRGALAKSDSVIVLRAQDRLFRLHKERVVIGSVVSADVRLSGGGVAPIHAVIEIQKDPVSGKDQAMIYDLASPTGVYLNGKKVITEKLITGDVIKIASHELKLSLQPLSEFKAQDEEVREVEGRKLFVGTGEDLKPLLLETDKDVREIFDYRPTSKEAIEVVMSWQSAILDVEHFVRDGDITVGSTRKADFGVPPLLSKNEFPLIRRKGDQYVLRLDPKMKGIIQQHGKLQQIEDLGQQEVSLSSNDFAKVSIGDIDLYLSFTAAPPTLKRRHAFERDPLFLKIFSSSMIMTAVIITTLLKTEVPQKIQVEKLPERVASILYSPERYPLKPRPKVQVAAQEKPQAKPAQPKVTKINLNQRKLDPKKPVPKVMDTGATRQKPRPSKVAQNQAKEGEGARAKGKEGTRGTRESKRQGTPQTVAKRPSPAGGEGSGQGRSEVMDTGNVDLLKGASSKILNLLGNTAANLGKSGKKLQGFGGFNTAGSGGLALQGEGAGGGGAADTTLGGLGNQGSGGGRVGTGKGAAGTGSGIIGGKARVEIRSGGTEEAIVMGAIDPSAIQAALAAHRDEFRYCYEKEINAENPDLSGRVGTTFVIAASGRVNKAGVTTTSLKNASVERCTISVIRRIEFPKPRGGGIVQVSYSFKYSPTGK